MTTTTLLTKFTFGEPEAKEFKKPSPSVSDDKVNNSTPNTQVGSQETQ
jgi:hypothetical protein